MMMILRRVLLLPLLQLLLLSASHTTLAVAVGGSARDQAALQVASAAEATDSDALRAYATSAVRACSAATSCSTCLAATVKGKVCPDNLCRWCSSDIHGVAHHCTPLVADGSDLARLVGPNQCPANFRANKQAWLDHDVLKTPYVPGCEQPRGQANAAAHNRRQSFGVELEISGWTMANPHNDLEKHQHMWSTETGMLAIEAEPQSAGWGIEFVTKPFQLTSAGRKEMRKTMDQAVAWCTRVKDWAAAHANTPIPVAQTLFEAGRPLTQTANVAHRNPHFMGAAQVTAAVRTDRLWPLFQSGPHMNGLAQNAHIVAAATAVTNHPLSNTFTPQYKSFLAYMSYMVSRWYYWTASNNNCNYYDGDTHNAKDGTLDLLVRTRMGDWLQYALGTMPPADGNAHSPATRARNWRGMLTTGTLNNILTSQRRGACPNIPMVHPNPAAIDPATGARPTITVEAWLDALNANPAGHDDQQWKMHGSFGTTGMQLRGDQAAVVVEFRRPGTDLYGREKKQGLLQGFARRVLTTDERDLSRCKNWKMFVTAYFDYMKHLNDVGLPDKVAVKFANRGTDRA